MRPRGFAIITVVYVVAILLVLGTAITVTAIAHSQLSYNSNLRMEAYNVAESGVADVMTRLGNGSIAYGGGAFQNGSASIGKAGAYKWTVNFNTTSNPLAVPNPLTAGGACNGVSPTQWDPGTNCVALPIESVFITISASYAGRIASTEAMATGSKINLGPYTILTKNTSGQNSGATNINSDPNGPPHNVYVHSNGGWTVSGHPTADGTVETVSKLNQANAVTKITGAPPFPFPSSNNLSQAKAQWIGAAKDDNCYYDPAIQALPGLITVPNGGTCFVNGNLDLGQHNVQQGGGLLVVAGAVTESGGIANYLLTAQCQSSCSCHKQAMLFALSTNGASLHGAGTQNGQTQSQGIIYVPNGPYGNLGNGAMQGAIVADTAQLGGSSGMTADHCTKDAIIDIPAYNLVAFGQD